jgi:hypothetical protein
MPDPENPAPAGPAPAPDRAALWAEFESILARIRKGEGDPESAARLSELNRTLHGK